MFISFYQYYRMQNVQDLLVQAVLNIHVRLMVTNHFLKSLLRIKRQKEMVAILSRRHELRNVIFKTAGEIKYIQTTFHLKKIRSKMQFQGLENIRLFPTRKILFYILCIFLHSFLEQQQLQKSYILIKIYTKINLISNMLKVF